jgi:hypothetical protein
MPEEAKAEKREEKFYLVEARLVRRDPIIQRNLVASIKGGTASIPPPFRVNCQPIQNSADSKTDPFCSPCTKGGMPLFEKEGAGEIPER